MIVLQGRIKYTIGIILDAKISLSGIAGRRVDDCMREDCLYGEINAGLVTSLNAQATVDACTATWLQDDYSCADVAVTPVSLVLTIGGGASINSKDSCTVGFVSTVTIGSLDYVFKIGIAGWEWSRTFNIYSGYSL